MNNTCELYPLPNLYQFLVYITDALFMGSGLKFVASKLMAQHDSPDVRTHTVSLAAEDKGDSWFLLESQTLQAVQEHTYLLIKVKGFISIIKTPSLLSSHIS